MSQLEDLKGNYYINQLSNFFAKRMLVVWGESIKSQCTEINSYSLLCVSLLVNSCV